MTACRTLKALSALLAYPSEELPRAMPELRRVIREEALLSAAEIDALEPLMRELEESDILDSQERYVQLFDRSRSLSLHLFEHVHGESRDRGQAMVELARMYAARGLDIDGGELPDYLPLFLEFLAHLPAGEAPGLLAEPVHILAVLRERLERRGSAYAAIFAVLEAMTGRAPGAEDLAALREEAEDNPDDLAALDRQWEEEAVSFAPQTAGEGGCPKASQWLDRIGAPGGGQAPASRS